MVIVIVLVVNRPLGVGINLSWVCVFSTVNFTQFPKPSASGSHVGRLTGLSQPPQRAPGGFHLWYEHTARSRPSTSSPPLHLCSLWPAMQWQPRYHLQTLTRDEPYKHTETWNQYGVYKQHGWHFKSCRWRCGRASIHAQKTQHIVQNQIIITKLHAVNGVNKLWRQWNRECTVFLQIF